MRDYTKIVILLLIFAGCSRRQDFIPFYALINEYEKDVFVDSKNFPDTISFSFFSDDFDPNTASLVELVGCKSDSIHFYASPLVHEKKLLTILEDCSGSMLEYSAIADSIVLYVLRRWGKNNAIVIRFARGYKVVAGPEPAELLIQKGITRWHYPDANGTDLAPAMCYVADSLATVSATVLITDGSVPWDASMKMAVQKFKQKKIPVLAVQICDGNNRVPEQIAQLTNGIFLPHYKWQKAASALDNSWIVKYKPAVCDTNGAKHNTILRWGGQKRTFSYIAPGKPNIEPKQLSSHETSIKRKEEEIILTLVEGLHIPFLNNNNSQLLPEATFLLDSIIKMIEILPDTFFPTVIVEGHTCNLGDSIFNKKLSEKRAKVVSHYIMKNCRHTLRVLWRGLGETCPILPNLNEENRRVNRRAEVKLMM